MARVIPLPVRHDDRHGTVCVMGDSVNGFQVAHESSSGNSWGSFSTYATGQAAITAAYAMNRDTYRGECNVWVCEAALQDARSVVAPPSGKGDL